MAYFMISGLDQDFLETINQNHHRAQSEINLKS